MSVYFDMFINLITGIETFNFDMVHIVVMCACRVIRICLKEQITFLYDILFAVFALNVTNIIYSELYVCKLKFAK